MTTETLLKQYKTAFIEYKKRKLFFKDGFFTVVPTKVYDNSVIKTITQSTTLESAIESLFE